MKKKRHPVPMILRVVRWLFPIVEASFPAIAQRYFFRIFFTPLRYKQPEKEKEWVEKAQKFEVFVNDKMVQAYSWGQGPVVMVVHGWAGRAAQFRKFIPVLTEAGYRVVGFDGPAHGYSQGKQTNVIEFEEVMKQLFEMVGIPVGVIAHSFGGVASLFAVKNGLPVSKLINIASPTIGDEIIRSYLKAINGSAKTGEAFKAHMMKKYGKSFDEFSALYSIQQLSKPIKLLLIHDENDKEVSIQHALELIKVYPQARLFKTTGLGHSRILKEERVIQKSLEFIMNEQ